MRDIVLQDLLFIIIDLLDSINSLAIDLQYSEYLVALIVYKVVLDQLQILIDKCVLVLPSLLLLQQTLESAMDQVPSHLFT